MQRLPGEVPISRLQICNVCLERYLWLPHIFIHWFPYPLYDSALYGVFPITSVNLLFILISGTLSHKICCPFRLIGVSSWQVDEPPYLQCLLTLPGPSCIFATSHNSLRVGVTSKKIAELCFAMPYDNLKKISDFSYT